MPKLNHRVTKQVLEFLRDLYVLRSWEDLTTHVIHSIPTLIPTDICSYNDMSSRRRYAAYRGWPDNHPTIPDAAAILGRFAHQHPLLTHVEQTRDLTTHKITDFASQRQFRTTDLYNEYYRPLQLPYNMGTCISLTKDSTLAIGLNRVKRDFADQDLAILDVLRPHLTQAYDNARVVSTMQEQIAAMRLTMGEGQGALLSYAHDGRIRWVTPSATKLLIAFGLQTPRRTNRLPGLLRDWLGQLQSRLNSMTNMPPPLTPLQINAGERSLRIRHLPHGIQSVLVLEEIHHTMSSSPLISVGLSPREAEILSWVTQGKTNPEIGTILGISRRTVQKHLERVYSRLGVENRHAAMALVREAMHHEGGVK